MLLLPLNILQLSLIACKLLYPYFELLSRILFNFPGPLTSKVPLYMLNSFKLFEPARPAGGLAKKLPFFLYMRLLAHSLKQSTGLFLNALSCLFILA